MGTAELSSLVISGICLFFCGLTAIFSFLAYAKVVGFENSTHQISYTPLDQELESKKGEEEGVSSDDIARQRQREKENILDTLYNEEIDHV